MSDAIVRILPLSALYRSIIRGQSRMDGRMPQRVVACPVQVQAWGSEGLRSRPDRDWMLSAEVENLHVLGVRVVEGAHDAQPELIWSVPVTGE